MSKEDYTTEKTKTVVFTQEVRIGNPSGYPDNLCAFIIPWGAYCSFQIEDLRVEQYAPQGIIKAHRISLWVMIFY